MNNKYFTEKCTFFIYSIIAELLMINIHFLKGFFNLLINLKLSPTTDINLPRKYE